jgi:hypothetical protein
MKALPRFPRPVPCMQRCISFKLNQAINNRARVQDSLLFRDSDLQTLAERRSLKWLPNASTTQSYLSLLSSPLSPVDQTLSAAAWAPLLLLPPPPEALLLVSIQLQAILYEEALRDTNARSKRRSRSKLPPLTKLTRSIGNCIVTHSSRVMESHHTRAYEAALTAALRVRKVAVARKGLLVKLREALPRDVRSCDWQCARGTWSHFHHAVFVHKTLTLSMRVRWQHSMFTACLICESDPVFVL